MTTSAMAHPNWCPFALNSLIPQPPPCASRELSTTGSPKPRRCIRLAAVAGGRKPFWRLALTSIAWSWMANGCPIRWPKKPCPTPLAEETPFFRWPACRKHPILAASKPERFRWIWERDRPGRPGRRLAGQSYDDSANTIRCGTEGREGFRRDAENGGRDDRAPQSNCIVPAKIHHCRSFAILIFFVNQETNG